MSDLVHSQGLVPAVDGVPAIPSTARSPQSFWYETPRVTAEDMCNGMYYDVFAIFMKFGKDKASIISEFGVDAGQAVETLMRKLMRGKNVRMGEIGDCSYFFGVQLRPIITTPSAPPLGTQACKAEVSKNQHRGERL